MIRSIYIDCSYGISGDMFTAALLQASDLEGKKIFEDVLKELKKEGIDAVIKQAVEHGVSGYQIEVLEGEKRYERLSDILEALENLNLLPEVKEIAESIIREIGEAEARVHGESPDKIHFHEIGSPDTLFDAVCSAALVAQLGIKQVFASSVPAGSGEIETMHGRMPVPAPATAELLKGMPLSGRKLSGEVTTPTGAAILRALKPQFIFPDGFVTEGIGYGIGTLKKPHPNYLRIFLGWVSEEEIDAVYEACANIDDATPQTLSAALQELLLKGALDAWVEQIVMKKSRPGFKLCFLAEESKIEELIQVCFKQTSTIGVRYHRVFRSKLKREVLEVETEFGRVRVKVSWIGDEAKIAAEFDDCLELAAKFGLPLDIIKKKAEYECARQLSERRNKATEKQES